jgi:hypothetical protein
MSIEITTAFSTKTLCFQLKKTGNTNLGLTYFAKVSYSIVVSKNTINCKCNTNINSSIYSDTQGTKSSNATGAGVLATAHRQVTTALI